MKYKLPALVLIMAFPTATSAEEIRWPLETLSYQPSDLPGFRLVQSNCLTCHSAHYVAYQPPLPASYWDATVRKMKNVFKAPIEEKDIAAMVDYLAQTYGDAGASPPTKP